VVPPPASEQWLCSTASTLQSTLPVLVGARTKIVGDHRSDALLAAVAVRDQVDGIPGLQGTVAADLQPLVTAGNAAAIAQAQAAEFIAGGGFQLQSPTPRELADLDEAIAVADNATKTFSGALQGAIDRGVISC